MKLRTTLIALLLVSTAAVLVARPSLDAQKPVTVFLLRHAETAASTATNHDPALSDAGTARARALARLIGEARATHLYSSELQRTRSTLAPLAEALALEVEVVSARAPEDQVARLRALPAGSVAIVAGHSNTIPQLVSELGGEARGLVEHPTHGKMLPHDAYDRLYIVTLPANNGAAAQTIELRYGD